jgi:hypothetical protein
MKGYGLAIKVIIALLARYEFENRLFTVFEGLFEDKFNQSVFHDGLKIQ